MASPQTITLPESPNGVAPPPPTATKNPPRPRIRAQLELVSNHKALEYLKDTFERQRPLRPNHVTFLRHLLRSGHWRQGAEIHLARLGDRRYLINGQHTLTAIAYEQQPTWLQIIEMTVPSYEEVGHLYESFDRPLQRSWADIYQANPDLYTLNFSTKQLQIVSGAMPVLARGFEGMQSYSYPEILVLRDPGVRFAFMQSWELEATNAFAGLKGAPHLVNALARAAVFAVILVTYRYQPDVAHRFWPAVARDSGLVEGQPERLLVHFLSTTPSRRFAPYEYARQFLNAWNAAYEQRPLSRLMPQATHSPVRIAGTPFEGKRVLVFLGPDGAIFHDPQPLAR